MKSTCPFRIALLFALPLVLSGCPVPIPPFEMADSRQNLGDAVPSFIVVGKTNRAEVLLGLGEPDALQDNSKTLIYRYRKFGGGVVFIVATIGAVGAVGGSVVMIDRRLTITFDATGIVTSAKLETESCRSSPGSPPCLNDTDAGQVFAPLGQVFAPASWHAGMNGFVHIRRFIPEPPVQYGTLVIGKSDIYFFTPEATEESEAACTIAFADLADIFVESFGLYRRVVIQRIDGSFESFTVGGEIVNNSATERAGNIAKAQWRSAPWKPQ